MNDIMMNSQELLEYLLSIIESFRSAMSRELTFQNFKEILLGFMMREDDLGVTDFVRLQPDEKESMDNCYQRLIKFFRSEGVDTRVLRKTWYRTVHECGNAVTVNGRDLVIFDGVKMPKAGHYCVGSMKMSQHSGSVSKAEHIMGHMTGLIGQLMESQDGRKFFCPLGCDIEDGVDKVREWENPAYVPLNHVEQMFAHAMEIFMASDRSLYVVCDRYFLSRKEIAGIDKANAEKADGCRMDIVTKAKSNIVAYERLSPSVIGDRPKRGRPPRRGAAFRPADLFSSKASDFTECTMELYDKEKDIRYYEFIALWGRGLYREMKFVLVELDGIRSILVSTDTTLSAQDIIRTYSMRWKCEESTLRSKHVIGSFSYHFWTKACPKVNIYRRKSDPDPLESVTDKDDQRRIIKALHATELFLQIGHMALGILQLLSIKARELCLTTTRWLRTYSSQTRSEQTMGYDLRMIVKCICHERYGSPGVKNMLETILPQTSPAISTKFLP